MTLDHRPRRKPTRLPAFDYRLPGPYFVTICTHQREHRFGEIIRNDMHLNGAGEMVAAIWESIPERFPAAIVDTFVVMPNHFHGVIWFNAHQENANPSLGDVMKWFKAGTTNGYIRGRTAGSRSTAISGNATTTNTSFGTTPTWTASANTSSTIPPIGRATPTTFCKPTTLSARHPPPHP